VLNQQQGTPELVGNLLVENKMVQEEEAKRSAERKGQIGSGDRSGRIRTYNFPQGRVTDHRIGLTLYKLDHILQGDVDEIVDSLSTFYQAEKMKNEGSASF